MEKRAPDYLRKTIFLLPSCSQILPHSFYSVLFILYLYPHHRPSPGRMSPSMTQLDAASLCFTVTVLQRTLCGLASAFLTPRSSYPLARWFPPHHSTDIISQRSPFHQNHRCSLSLCHHCPLQHLQLFSPFLRVLICILITLSTLCFSAFSTGASCSLEEFGLHAAFSLPVLMGACLFPGSCFCWKPVDSSGLDLSVSRTVSQGSRLPAGRLELNALFLSHFTCLQLNCLPQNPS